MQPRTIKINDYILGEGRPPCMVAEVSCNHMGSLERAKEIMKVSKEAGADVIKLQTYTADTLTMKADQGHFKVDHPLWKNMTLHDLYAKAQTPFEWMAPLFEYGEELGLIVFSAPFDFTAADLLIKLDAPLFKIASFEAVHLPLIRKVAAAGKPLVISTGMANEQEIDEAVSTAREAGCDEIVLLHCISSYPTPIEQANIRTVELLKERFGVLVGLSDHTKSTLAAELAVGLGACMVEKHVMLTADDDTYDKAFSLTPDQFAELVTACKSQTPQKFAAQCKTEEAQKALGRASFDMKEGEVKSVAFRPSILVAKDIKAGEKFSADNLAIRRPGAGLAPKYWEDVIGKKAAVSLSRGDAMSWDAVEGAKQHTA